MHNRYYCNVRMNHATLALLPDDGNLSGLRSVTLSCTADDNKALPSQGVDPYTVHLSASFVPSTARQCTEQETVRRSLQK